MNVFKGQLRQTSPITIPFFSPDRTDIISHWEAKPCTLSNWHIMLSSHNKAEIHQIIRATVRLWNWLLSAPFPCWAQRMPPTRDGKFTVAGKRSAKVCQKEAINSSTLSTDLHFQACSVEISQITGWEEDGWQRRERGGKRRFQKAYCTKQKSSWRRRK